MSKYTLNKSERLKKRNLIRLLFEEGKSLKKFPLKMLFLESDVILEHPVLFGVTIPKKSFKKAVDRNLLKRRIRESYRLKKPVLYHELADHDKQYILMFIYTSRKIEDFKLIDLAVQFLLDKFTNLYRSNADS